MIDTLIEEGKALAVQVRQGTMGRSITGVEFETWASKVAMYLYQYHKGSPVEQRASDNYKSLGVNSLIKYEALLGAVIAAKAIEEEEKKIMDQWEV